VNLAAKIGDGLMAIAGMDMGAISNMASAIANAIKGAIGLGASQAPGPHVTPAPMAPDGGMGGVLPQRWTPPPRAPGVQETRVNINLDGYRLGEAVAYHVARANQHVAAVGAALRDRPGDPDRRHHGRARQGIRGHVRQRRSCRSTCRLRETGSPGRRRLCVIAQF
jgi:hypothetical protein